MTNIICMLRMYVTVPSSQSIGSVGMYMYIMCMSLTALGQGFISPFLVKTNLGMYVIKHCACIHVYIF